MGTVLCTVVWGSSENGRPGAALKAAIAFAEARRLYELHGQSHYLDREDDAREAFLRAGGDATQLDEIALYFDDSSGSGGGPADGTPLVLRCSRL